MMRASLRLLLPLLWLAGCSGRPLTDTIDMSGPHSFVAVTLVAGSMIANIDRFEIVVIGGGGPALRLATTPAARPGTIPPSLTFTMNLPADRTGNVSVSVVAFDSAGVPVGHAAGNVDLVALGTATLTLVMTSG